MFWWWLVAVGLAVAAFRRTRNQGELVRRIEALERELQRLKIAPSPPAAEASSRAAPPAAVAPPVVPPPTPAETPLAPAPPRAPIDYERLVIRGLMIVVGVAFALAVLFFVQEAESPWLRVALGLVSGTVAVVGAERWLRPSDRRLADAVAGGGVVALYAALWAMGILYHLTPLAAAFIGMVVVTGLCAVLAVQQGSLVVATFGLVGGFATPLLLSTHADHPLGLFGYLFLLNAGLLWMAQRRGWPNLGLAGVLGTTAYQAGWLVTRGGEHTIWLTLVILATFALLFMAATQRVPAERREEWAQSQALGLLVPFGLSIYLAARADLGPHLYPMALLLLVLNGAAAWISTMQRRPALATGAAAGTVGVLAVWLLLRTLSTTAALEAALVCVGLALPFQVAVEYEPDERGMAGVATASIVASIGLVFLLAVAAASQPVILPWPWLVGALGLATIAARHATFPEREWLYVAAGLGVSLLCTGHYLAHPVPLATDGWYRLVFLVPVLFQIVAFVAQPPAAMRHADHAAALVPVVLVGGFFVLGGGLGTFAPVEVMGVSLSLALLTALSAARLGSGEWFCAAVVVTALAHCASAYHESWGLSLTVGAVLLLTAWPFMVGNRFLAAPLAWYGAALVGPAWFMPLRRLYLSQFGATTIGLLPLGLALVAFTGAWQARRVWPAGHRLRANVLALFAAVALGFVSVAIPLQLEREWVTVGWALEVAAVCALWLRLDHPGLKYFALALALLVTGKLVLVDEILLYHERGAWRIVNWLAYTYLVPAAALLAATAWLERREVARLRDWERSWYVHGYALGAAVTGLGALLLIFVWLNLAIADWFATSRTLGLDFSRHQARDLTTSLVWALYAVALVVAGGRRRAGLRWVSLALLVLTTTKVALHDIGELRGLYRPASLAGLGLVVLAEVLLYQRLVFRGATEEER